jgi:hypothetical protein
MFLAPARGLDDEIANPGSVMARVEGDGAFIDRGANAKRARPWRALISLCLRGP